MILKAPQLLPLTKEEINGVLEKVRVFHGRAYQWEPEVSLEAMIGSMQSGGYLLRTKIRAAIEFLDQLYQYGRAGNTRIDELGKETFEEEVPSLEGLTEE